MEPTCYLSCLRVCDGTDRMDGYVNQLAGHSYLWTLRLGAPRVEQRSMGSLAVDSTAEIFVPDLERASSIEYGFLSIFIDFYRYTCSSRAQTNNHTITKSAKLYPAKNKMVFLCKVLEGFQFIGPTVSILH